MALPVPGPARLRLARLRLLPGFCLRLLRAAPAIRQWFGSRDPAARARVKRILELMPPEARLLGPQGLLPLAPPAPAPGTRSDAAARPGPQAPPVTVILPVYGAHDLLRDCLARLARHSDLPWRLIAVEDASPDPRIRPLLAAFAASHPAGQVTVLENPRNLGFVGAVNRGLARAAEAGADAPVVLLNSDALVPPGWLSRLLAPLRAAPERVASVTPMSNDAELLSVPRIGAATRLRPGEAEVIDALARRLPAAEPVEMPTGVGFCLALNPRFLARIPQLDPAFGRGYGEEVDWCQKALALGGQHLAQPRLFVEHRGAASFGAAGKARLLAASAALLGARYPQFDASVQQFLAEDPLLGPRLALGLGLAAARAGAAPVPVWLAHSLGGGAEAWLARELADRVQAGGMAVVLRVGGPRRWRLELHGPGEAAAAGETGEAATGSRQAEEAAALGLRARPTQTGGTAAGGSAAGDPGTGDPGSSDSADGRAGAGGARAVAVDPQAGPSPAGGAAGDGPAAGGPVGRAWVGEAEVAGAAPPAALAQTGRSAEDDPLTGGPSAGEPGPGASAGRARAASAATAETAAAGMAGNAPGEVAAGAMAGDMAGAVSEGASGGVFGDTSGGAAGKAAGDGAAAAAPPAILADSDDTALVLQLLRLLPRRRVIYSCGVGDSDPVELPRILLALAEGTEQRLEILLHDYFPFSPSHSLLGRDGRYRGLPRPPRIGSPQTDSRQSASLRPESSRPESSRPDSGQTNSDQIDSGQTDSGQTAALQTAAPDPDPPRPDPARGDPAHTTLRPDGSRVSLARWQTEWTALARRADRVVAFSQASAALAAEMWPFLIPEAAGSAAPAPGAAPAGHRPLQGLPPQGLPAPEPLLPDLPSRPLSSPDLLSPNPASAPLPAPRSDPQIGPQTAPQPDPRPGVLPDSGPGLSPGSPPPSGPAAAPLSTPPATRAPVAPAGPAPIPASRSGDPPPAAAGRLAVVPHRLLHLPPRLPAPPVTARPVLGVLGNMAPHKGAGVVAALSRLPGARLVVLGEMDPAFRLGRGVRVHGAFRHTDLPALVARYGIAGWLIPSLWPETFSFATREALATGLPVWCFDLGAQAEAVRAALAGKAPGGAAGGPAGGVLPLALAGAPVQLWARIAGQGTGQDAASGAAPGAETGAERTAGR